MDQVCQIHGEVSLGGGNRLAVGAMDLFDSTGLTRTRWRRFYRRSSGGLTSDLWIHDVRQTDPRRVYLASVELVAQDKRELADVAGQVELFGFIRRKLKGDGTDHFGLVGLCSGLLGDGEHPDARKHGPRKGLIVLVLAANQDIHVTARKGKAGNPDYFVDFYGNGALALGDDRR